MNNGFLLDDIKKESFTRQDILKSACKGISGFKETDMRNLLEGLMEDGSLVRVGRNLYMRRNDAVSEREYVPVYSEEALKLIGDIRDRNHYVDFQVWELNWFNEFLVHMVARNIVFLDVENEGCEFVYTSLYEDYIGRMLLKPSPKELLYYVQPEGIIIERQVSESPRRKENGYETPIEKLIVELFANKILRSMISQGDYPHMLDSIFDKYSVDQVKMLRYARRRNKKDELVRFLKDNTNVRLLVEA